MKKYRILLAGCLAAVMLAIPGCGKKESDTVSIAQQFGVAYAPLQIMKEKQFLEEKLPGVKIEWKQFGGPTAIREGMLNGEIDFGFMGVAPVLVGIDNGMKWRYAAGLSSNEVAIVTIRDDMESLKDVTEKDRIAILSPACTQHVLLCMLAEEQLGDARILDNQLVSMSHPDSVNALLSGTEITAHVATPPYISMEADGGAKVLATGEDIMGEPFTFITCVAMEDFYQNNREYYDAFLAALQESVDYINENRSEAIALLAPVYGITEAELAAQMDYNGTIYSTELSGIETFSRRMSEMGFTGKDRPMSDLVFDNVVYR